MVWLLGFIILAVIGLQAGVFVARRITVARDAADEWRVRVEKGDSRLSGLSEAQFARTYQRCYGPRAQGYILAALGTIALATPLVLAPLGAALRWMTRDVDMVRVRQLEVQGDLVFQFFLFLALPAVWAGIAAVFARIYYRRKPMRFDSELIKAGLKPTGDP